MSDKANERVAGGEDEPGQKWSERKLPEVPGKTETEDAGLTPHAKARQEYLARSGGQHLSDERDNLKKGWEEEKAEQVLQGSDLTTVFEETDITRDRASDTNPTTDSDNTSYEHPAPVTSPIFGSGGYRITGDGTDKQRK